MALTPKQRRFVAEYLTDPIGAQAYIRAGYSANGAAQGAERLLRNVDVAAAIAGGQKKLARKFEITADRVLQELALLAFAPLGDKDVSTSEKRGALVDLGKHLNLFKPLPPNPYDDPDADGAEAENVPVRETGRAILLALQTLMRQTAGTKAAPAAAPTKH